MIEAMTAIDFADSIIADARAVQQQLTEDNRFEGLISSRMTIPRPFIGIGPVRLVIIGQDPTVQQESSRASIATVLNLDREGALRTVRGHRPQTIENALIGARTILRWAAAQGLISKPPKVPKFRVPAPQHDVLYAGDVEATIACAAAPLDTMLHLMWETGLRISEAATTRGCYLIEGEKLVIVQEREFNGGTFVPKTEDSTRRVPVTDELMARLQGLVSSPDAPLFPCNVDRMYHCWRHRFYKAQKAAGVRRYTFHDLRRAVADRLWNGGVPLDRYAKIMGHAPVTAVRHYSTVAPGDLRDALEMGLRASRRRST